jgi:hypothetical protein
MKLNSKGQALLLVIAAMTVALALGINVSMRTLQSISRTSRSDTSERILAAAEGGVERALKLSPRVLDGGINNSGDCALMGSNASIVGGDCVVSFQTGTDPIIAKAKVVVSDFTYTDVPNKTYKFKVEQDSVTEVNVEGVSSLQVCWTPTTKSDLYGIVYGDSGVLAKIGLRALAPDSPGGTYSPNNFDEAVSHTGKRNCSGNYNLFGNALGLRIKSIGGDSTVEVKSDTLPNQGHKIVSTGYLTSDPTSKKVVTVYKSLPFLPSIFDFGIMSANGSLGE